MYIENYIIYADILFLINFSVDFICLFLAGRLTSRLFSAWKMILSASLLALYSFVPYLNIEIPVFLKIFMHFSFAALCVFIAFWKSDIKKFFMSFMTFCITEALLGGAVSAINSLTSSWSDGTYREISAKSLAFSLFVSAVAAAVYGSVCKNRMKIKSAKIKLSLGSYETFLNLLIDSGNLVTEPFSALPVIVVSSSALPPPYDSPDPDTYPLRLRAIPFKTASGSGMIYGFLPESAEYCPLIGKKKKIEAYIGIDTETKSFSGFDGLMPPGLL